MDDFVIVAVIVAILAVILAALYFKFSQRQKVKSPPGVSIRSARTQDTQIATPQEPTVQPTTPTTPATVVEIRSTSRTPSAVGTPKTPARSTARSPGKKKVRRNSKGKRTPSTSENLNPEKTQPDVGEPKDEKTQADGIDPRLEQSEVRAEDKAPEKTQSKDTKDVTGEKSAPQKPPTVSAPKTPVKTNVRSAYLPVTGTEKIEALRHTYN